MLLQFDFNSEIPLYQQLRNQVVIGIAENKLHPGDRLPAIRVLAEESGINMMTVSKGYQLLKREGYISTDRRSGAVILPRGDQVPIPRDTVKALRLIMSELRLAGVACEEVISLCQKLFEEGEHDR